jgi:hypothetical protein
VKERGNFGDLDVNIGKILKRVVKEDVNLSLPAVDRF